MKDLEFHVDKPNGTTAVLASFDKACGLAAGISASNGQPVNVDVIVYSRAAARAWGGDTAVEVYVEDPDASVHERIVIRAESLGRIR